MPKNILVDSGYWIALFTARDDYHEDAVLYDEYLTVHKLIVPWPSLYEFLNTRFTKRPENMALFKKKIIQPNVIRIPDETYRDEALTKFLINDRHHLNLSLVDLVIREVISDEAIRIDAMVTFNEKDFADLCAYRKIEFFKG